MAKWITVAVADDVPSESCRELVADGRLIALFNVDGEFFALDGVCPHQGGPLGKGALEGKVVTCPWHGWQFDVSTGRHCINSNLTQPTLPVRVEAGDLQVDVESL